MPYQFLNFDPELRETFDDQIENELNKAEMDGWEVVDVHYYDNGFVKMLLKR